MNTNSCSLHVGGIEALVVRKPIKNLHLSVLPPNGYVRVSAPVRMSDDAIRTLLATKISWIHKQRARFSGQERQTVRRYLSGESHYYLGKRYRLDVVYVNGPSYVELKGKNVLILQARPRSEQERRERVLHEWYRNELRTLLAPMIEEWQERLGVEPTSWDIKRMKTRWGTCNHKAGRIWLNLELIKKPLSCIEYVVVHELVHLIEKKHNDRFTELMSRHLPRWRSTKDNLNRFILSHENWEH
ncbi:metal-dependent hydrolase [Candidatus Kaiserbacteria bacterium RIFCSPHIGHO2_02_FULL_54_11b]|uniref:Metal-dependent hydrolase n=2 Tax=Candidatus Kaiseribacteriota TaxID=1752734 RepID=A0A1F6CJD6_9BACT|nr:MAG: metal-dependent hydrolase [Candidatus Kaiserbacteria bacterium RIFCSPHIGHO2_01_FULL_54_36b]OGG64804.1 MAG: metal-dependent hydrolase [Candidatus Kaiserbacteria bacterium RIFCSPHIGHO2_02_FULL_54_11b]